MTTKQSCLPKSLCMEVDEVLVVMLGTRLNRCQAPLLGSYTIRITLFVSVFFLKPLPLRHVEPYSVLNCYYYDYHNSHFLNYIIKVFDKSGGNVTPTRTILDITGHRLYYYVPIKTFNPSKDALAMVFRLSLLTVNATIRRLPLRPQLCPLSRQKSTTYTPQHHNRY
jgi:hypothetical protein